MAIGSAQGRNLRYIELVKWAAEFTISVSTNGYGPKMQEVADTFTSNVRRLSCLAKMPASAVGSALLNQQCYDMARFNIFGKVAVGSDEDEAMNFQKVAEEKDRLWPLMDIPQAQPCFDASSKKFSEFIDEAFVKHPDGIAGIEVLFSSLVTGAWTAFEVLATDLWIESLNHHPADLAALAGIKGRISKLAKTPLAKDDYDKQGDNDQKPSISLDDIQNLTRKSFSLANCMGNILKRGRKFSTLTGIREAYSYSFSRNSQLIDSALSDNSLDAVSIVRNLIVHRGGIADKKYVDQQRVVTLAPPVLEREQLLLDGAVVATLIDGAFKASFRLLNGVSKWILAN